MNAYVGGEFTKIGGMSRNHVAKLNLATGSLESDWDPNADAVVFSLALDGTNLFTAGMGLLRRDFEFATNERWRQPLLSCSSGSVTSPGRLDKDRSSTFHWVEQLLLFVCSPLDHLLRKPQPNDSGQKPTS